MEENLARFLGTRPPRPIPAGLAGWPRCCGACWAVAGIVCRSTSRRLCLRCRPLAGQALLPVCAWRLRRLGEPASPVASQPAQADRHRRRELSDRRVGHLAAVGRAEETLWRAAGRGHACLGVLGQHGRGTAEYFGLTGEIDLCAGDFSATLGSRGNYIAGPRRVVEFLRWACPAIAGSPALPSAAAAAAAKTLELLQRLPRAAWSFGTTWLFCAGLRELGLEIGNPEGPITSIAMRRGAPGRWSVSSPREHDILAGLVVRPAVARRRPICVLRPPRSTPCRTVRPVVEAIAEIHTRQPLQTAPDVLAAVGPAAAAEGY